MQTAFYEIVFYLNKQPHSHKSQTKNDVGSLLNSFHITKGVCKYNGGGRGNKYERRNWIKDSMRRVRCRLWGRQGKRRRTERKRESRRFPDRRGWGEVIAMSWMPRCPQIPNGEGKTTPTSPTQLTKDCTTCSILLLTRQMPLTDSHSGAKKRILRVGQARAKKKKIPTNTNLHWRPLWASKNPLRKSCRGPSMPLLKTTPHNQFLWVMSHGLLPLLLPCFFLILVVWYTEAMSEKKYHFIVHLQGFLVYWI